MTHKDNDKVTMTHVKMMRQHSPTTTQCQCGTTIQLGHMMTTHNEATTTCVKTIALDAWHNSSRKDTFEI